MHQSAHLLAKYGIGSSQCTSISDRPAGEVKVASCVAMPEKVVDVVIGRVEK